MAFLTDYEYHENGGKNPSDANHGSYQFVNLVDLVNNFMMNYTGNNNVIRNVPRHKVIFEMKQAIKELNYDSLKEIRVMQIDVNDDLSIVLPSDYVKYVRISLYSNGRMTPLVEDGQSKWALAYLKDSQGEIIFDNDGYIINTNLSPMEEDRLAGKDVTEFTNQIGVGSRYGIDPSKAVAGPTFDVDKRSGVINFSSDAAGQSFIIEYVSDGMEDGNSTKIAVNKLFERYIYAKTAYEIVQNKMGVQEYIVRRLRKKSTAEWRNASIRMQNFDPVNLLMSLRGRDKRIK